MSGTPIKLAIKLAIVDDSAVVRTTLSALVADDPEITLHGVASDPVAAEEKFSRIGWPDVMILDIDMPRMDGLTFMRKMMQEHPTPVIICSSVAQEGSQNAIEALSLGAVEVIAKPDMGLKEFFEESKQLFTQAVHAAYAAREGLKKAPPHTPVAPPHLWPPRADHCYTPSFTAIGSIMAVGASTGGVQTLERILSALPVKTPPILIVQHMPAGFTKSLAARLDKLCRISVKEAENGDRLLHGRALIAPGDRHMTLKYLRENYCVEIKDGPRVNRHKPSIDVLFRSCAEIMGAKATGIILTGMGDDGVRGLRAMLAKGSKTYAQNEESSIVYGMPKEALQSGAALTAVTPEQITKIIQKG